jgi:hypothetical protein
VANSSFSFIECANFCEIRFLMYVPVLYSTLLHLCGSTSDSYVSEDVGIEHRIVATIAVILSNHLARSRPFLILGFAGLIQLLVYGFVRPLLEEPPFRGCRAGNLAQGPPYSSHMGSRSSLRLLLSLVSSVCMKSFR